MFASVGKEAPSTKVGEGAYKDAHIDRVRRKAKSVLRTIPKEYEEDERPQMSKIQSQTKLPLAGGAMNLINGIN